MATLHMEVESARSTQNSMVNSRSQLESTVQGMSSSVQGLVGSAWMGNSANEFMNEYEQWRNTMNQLMEQLNTLNTRLMNEIVEWENMAAKLA